MNRFAVYSLMVLAGCTDESAGTPVDACSACASGAIRVGRVFAEAEYPSSLVAANASGKVVRASTGELQWLDGSLAPTRTRWLENASGTPLQPWKLAIGQNGDVVVLAGIIEQTPRPHPIGTLIAFRADGTERWRKTFMTEGPSNLAVGEHRVFLGSGKPSSLGIELDGILLLSTYAAALDLDTGALKWSFTIPGTSSDTDEKDLFVAALPSDEVAIAGVIPRDAELSLGGTAVVIPMADHRRAFVAAIDVRGNGRWAIPVESARASELTGLASGPGGEIAATFLHDIIVGSDPPDGLFDGHAFRGSTQATLISLDGEVRWIQPAIRASSIATDGADVVVAGTETYHIDRGALVRIGATGERWKRSAPYAFAVAAVTDDQIVAALPAYEGLVYAETTLHDTGLLVARLIP